MARPSQGLPGGVERNTGVSGKGKQRQELGFCIGGELTQLVP